MKEPNERLKRERERHCWSQAEVAAKIKTNAFTVSRWESGATFPSIMFRRRLCKLFGKSAEELGLLPEESMAHLLPHSSLEAHQSKGVSSISSPAIRDPAIPTPISRSVGLVGRDDVLHQLGQSLCANGGSFALRGLPGVGKTALAIELAHNPVLVHRFRDGILWAGLGREPNLSGLLSRWGMLLGLVPNEAIQYSTSEAWIEAIHNTIGLRHMLLIIDDAWASKEALLFKVGGPNCTHLLTTRFPAIAHQFAKNSDGIFVIRELNKEDSVTLLARLAPHFTTHASHEAEKLAASVGGLPLALTLIGKYLHLQTHSGQPRRLHTALSRLHHANERLHLAEPQAPSERSPSLPISTPLSLHTAIEISDEQLNERTRLAFRALAIFPAKPNSFSEEAALAVGAMTVEMIDMLTDIGLLEGSGPGRYTLHQTIADYARFDSVQEAVEERLVTFFVAYVTTQQANFDLLELEVSNILLALQTAFNRQMTSAYVCGVNAFAPFLEARGLYALAEEHLQLAHEIALAQDNDSYLALNLFHLGRIAELRGDLSLAERWYREGLSKARPLNLREIMCAILTHTGEVAVNSGDYLGAEQALREGLELAHELGNRSGMSYILKNLGEMAESRGDYDQAEELYQHALALARQSNDREITCALLQNLGAKAARQGYFELGERYLQEGLIFARMLQHKQRMSGLLLNLGALAAAQNQFTLAGDYYQETFQLAQQIGHRLRIGSVLQNMGELEIQRENYHLAQKHLQESLEIAQNIGHGWLISETLNVQGECYLKQQQFDAAEASWKEALQKGRELGGLELIATSLYGLARIQRAYKNDNAAIELGEESYKLFKVMHHEKRQLVRQWLKTPFSEEYS
ncbi:MAG TPA: tetratricopeptide repeat protein [Ktedonobacteraceae bacterium]|nr:tetratricopeptide repeat protein [Ktedonobacteraceae bacterium]